MSGAKLITAARVLTAVLMILFLPLAAVSFVACVATWVVVCGWLHADQIMMKWGQS